MSDATPQVKVDGDLQLNGSVPLSGKELAASGALRLSGTLPLSGDLKIGKTATTRANWDPFRPILSVNNGVAAASVALIAPVFIALPNVRNTALLSALLDFLFWMALVVIATVGVAIVLQALRFLYVRSAWPRALPWAVPLCVSILLILIPTVLGGFALDTLIKGILGGEIAIPPS